MTTFIISGGQIHLEFVAHRIKQEKNPVIIAADKGVEACMQLQLTPDYIIGDFDSIQPETERFLQQHQSAVTRLQPKKDDTDTEAALRLALEKTKGDIVLLGATGTRLDHVIGNLSILGLGLEHGRNVMLMDEHNRIRVVQKSLTIKKEEQFGKYISIFPMMGKAKGVTLEGMAYPLQDATLEGFNSLGVSNEIVDAKANITVKEGLLLVIESTD